MKLLLITDAWEPQINGVVTTLLRTVENLESWGHTVRIVHPGLGPNLRCPFYKSIPLAWRPGRSIRAALDGEAFDAVHIATEGPLGLAARRECLRRKLAFTTSYHTRFPEYLRARLPIPLAVSYAWLRWFHRPAQRVLVTTPSMRRALRERGFRHLATWPRGVDTDLFQPSRVIPLKLPRPIFLYAGRVAVEKNLRAFLDLDLPGSKVVIGDGPDREMLERQYPEALFTGFKTGERLAGWMAAADVFVFPSLTDTFGLVILEALASGTPVAAFPAPGPRDILRPDLTGICHSDLQTAALGCLALDGERCRTEALTWSWEAASRRFLQHLVPVERPTAQTALRVLET